MIASLARSQSLCHIFFHPPPPTYPPRSACLRMRTGRVEPVEYLHEEEQNMWLQKRIPVTVPWAPSAGPQPRHHLPCLCTLANLLSTDREEEVHSDQDTLRER